MVEKVPTHIAYAIKREGRGRSRAVEIGNAYIESDFKKVHQVSIDRLPIGGFSGQIILTPVGAKAPELETHPERPSEDD